MRDSTNAASSGLDLSNVPEPMRSLILKQLDKMPAPLREKLLREGSPILDRIIAKAREHAGGSSASTASLPPSTGQSYADAHESGPVELARSQIPTNARERVPTVMPGDSGSHAVWLFAIAIALVAAAWYAMQG
jgi:hypothetical protein